MGTGASRGKKVAPVCVSEVSVTKTGSDVATHKQDNSSQFKPLETHTIVRNARKSAQRDCHREGHGSHFSGEDGDVDGELDIVLEDYEDRERASVKKTPQKRSVIKSKKYGLCHFSREDTEDDASSAPPRRASGRAEEPRVPHGVPKDVNKRSNHAFTRLKQHTPACSNQHNSCLAKGTLFEAVPTSEEQPTCGSCQSASLTMSAMLYDGSEEELMDTIEREFS
ncbi:uncharacterized protein PAE49_018595 [Odontesthes bonariensis]|uniref:uncharacterized protein LOC142366391 n=1 Tax=Odontesthes bonariensis TaxID=219752 RepID=UPI003F58E572